MFNSIKNKLANGLANTIVSVQDASKERKEFLNHIEDRVESQVFINFDKIAAGAGIDVSSPVYGTEIKKLRTAYKTSIENDFIKEHEIEISRRSAKKENAKRLQETLRAIVKTNSAAIKDEAQMQLLLSLANKLGVNSETDENSDHR